MVRYTNKAGWQYFLSDVLLTVDYDDSGKIFYFLCGVIDGELVPAVVNLDMFSDLQEAIKVHKALKESIEEERKVALKALSFEELLSPLTFPEVANG